MLEAIQGSAPLADVVPAFTNPDWLSHVGQLALWLVVATITLGAMVLARRVSRRASAWTLAAVACSAFLIAGAVLTASPFSISFDFFNGL